MILIRATVALAIVAALAGCATQAVPTAQKDPATASAAATATPKTPPPPSLSTAQQQAVIAAKGYLGMGGFSYQGLIEQLSSSSGDGFSVADATTAANSLTVDYNAQAVTAAQGYMKMGGFSHASMVEQLTSANGDKFTPEQAEFAATKVGL